MMYIICNLKYDQISHAFAQLKISKLCFKQPSLTSALTLTLFLRERIVMGLMLVTRHTVRVHHRGFRHVMQ